MDHNDRDARWEEGEEVSPLPSRKEYHQRKKRKQKRRNPFLLSRILLVLFMIFVIAALVFSISNFP